MSFHKLRVLILISIFPLLVNGQFTADVTKGCNPLTVNFTAVLVAGATDWEWDFDDGSPHVTGNSFPSHTYTQAGSYDVVLISLNASNDTIRNDTLENFITVYAVPDVSFDTIIPFYSSFAVILINQSTIHNVSGIYIWDYDDATPLDTVFESMHKYTQEGNYTIKLRAIDREGCTDSTDITVAVTHQFFIPNVFTPNEDDINDRFMVLANGFDVFPDAIIYNRWGTIVYKIENVSQLVWDGRTFDGTLVSPGTYFYVISKPVNSDYDYLDSKLKGTIQVIYN